MRLAVCGGRPAGRSACAGQAVAREARAHRENAARARQRNVARAHQAASPA